MNRWDGLVQVGEVLSGWRERTHVRRVDQELEIRERIVHILDELDADDVNSARFYLQGLLDDLDAAVHDGARRPTKEHR